MLPAADFDFALVRPSRNTDDAFVAAFFEVTFRVLLWDSADPAADRDFFPVDLFVRVFEAFVAAAFDVRFPCAMVTSVGSPGDLRGCCERVGPRLSG